MHVGLRMYVYVFHMCACVCECVFMLTCVRYYFLSSKRQARHRPFLSCSICVRVSVYAYACVHACVYVSALARSLLPFVYVCVIIISPHLLRHRLRCMCVRMI